MRNGDFFSNTTTRPMTIGLAAGTLAALVAIAAPGAQGATLLEWNFQQSNGNLSEAKPGTSTTGALVGSATVNTGSNGALDQPSYDPDIRTGRLNVPDSTSVSQGVRTDTSAGEWRDYLGVESAGTGTAYVVFKPGFTYVNSTVNGEGGKPKPDHIQALWSVYTYGSSSGINLIALNSVNGGDVQFTTGYASVAITDNSFNFDNDDWYMLATSWQEGSVPTVYLRALTGGDTAARFAAGSSNTSANLMGPNENVKVGYADTFGSPYVGAGDYGLFRITDQYTSTQAGFDAIYQSLTAVPEPASFVMLLGMGGLMLARRRPTA